MMTKRKDDVLKMNKPILKIKKLNPDVSLPEKKTAGAACCDIACLSDMTIYPHEEKAACIPTGLAFEIPKGYHIQIYLRSSTGANRHLRLANGTGIIDSDYRGEIKLLLENLGKQPEHVKAGQRLCQFMLVKDLQFEIKEEVKSLSETKRGKGAMGSTGE